MAAVQRQVRQLRLVDQARAHAVVHVVHVVGHLVGQVDELRFERRLAAGQEAVRDAAGLGALQPLGVGARTVLEDAFARFEAQVQAVEARQPLLELVHHAQALQVVLEAVVRAHALVQRILPSVAEGRVAEVVRERDRLAQVFVERERARRRAGAICATSSEWVSRVRNRSPSWLMNTCVL